MTTESERETIAARWLIEQDDPDFSDGQRAELTRWIMQSADNCNTYVRLVRAWRWAVLLHRAEPPIVHRKAAPVGSSSRFQSSANKMFFASFAIKSRQHTMTHKTNKQINK